MSRSHNLLLYHSKHTHSHHTKENLRIQKKIQKFEIYKNIKVIKNVKIVKCKISIKKIEMTNNSIYEVLIYKTEILILVVRSRVKECTKSFTAKTSLTSFRKIEEKITSSYNIEKLCYYAYKIGLSFHAYKQLKVSKVISFEIKHYTFFSN